MKINEESIVYLLIRVIIGIIFVFHGYNKLLDLQNWNKFIVSKNLPEFLGIFSALFETIIGILLIIGFLTRLSSLGLIIFMIIAIYLAHIEEPIYKYLYQISIILLGITLLITGSGNYSVDNFITLNLKKYLLI
uniref:DoxX family protein n=1 Tax=viral metagenome TaxID=1070528 RepID=A0A6C0E229_9ZZZZ